MCVCTVCVCACVFVQGNHFTKAWKCVFPCLPARDSEEISRQPNIPLVFSQQKQEAEYQPLRPMPWGQAWNESRFHFLQAAHSCQVSALIATRLLQKISGDVCVRVGLNSAAHQQTLVCACQRLCRLTLKHLCVRICGWISILKACISECAGRY